MVCIKQVSIPAIVLLSIAEQSAAAPLGRQTGTATRDVNEPVGPIDLATRQPGFASIAKKVGGIIKKNPGKTLDRTLSTANTGMAIANTNKAMKGKRDMEDYELALRDLEELDERDIEELELALRDMGFDERDWEDLEERSIWGKVAGVAAKAAKKVVGVIKKNPGKTFDRTLSTANTAMAVANTNKAQKGKRDFEEFTTRDVEELLEYDTRDLTVEERGILAKVMKPVAKAVQLIKHNPGKTFDRTLSTANTAMAVANTNKAMKGKRDIEEIDARDVEELLEYDTRDLTVEERGILAKVMKPVAKAVQLIKHNPGKTLDRGLSTANTAMNVANTHKAQQGKRDTQYMEERDYDDMEERDYDDMEERDYDDMEERDFEDMEERDLDDLEARGVGAVLKKVAKGVFKAGDIISANQGKSYNRANAAANAAMNAANTKKKQEKRDIEELGFEERDFEYVNSLSQRELEDLELVVRALYGNEIDLE